MESDENREFESVPTTETEGKDERAVEGAVVNREDKDVSEHQHSEEPPRRSERLYIPTKKMLIRKLNAPKKEQRLSLSMNSGNYKPVEQGRIQNQTF